MKDKSILMKPNALAVQTGVEAAIAAGLQDYQEGRVTRAFSSMKEFEDSLMKTYCWLKSA